MSLKARLASLHQKRVVWFFIGIALLPILNLLRSFVVPSPKDAMGWVSFHKENLSSPKLSPPPDEIITGFTEDSNTETITLPVKSLNAVLKSPISADLIPKSGFLHTLGISEVSAVEVKKAFELFKSALEESEFRNFRLVKKDDGEYFEITPFVFPKQHLNSLSQMLDKALGQDDWRTDLLVGSLQSSIFTGGMGKYRQEIAIQTEKDTGGGNYDMVYTKIFDLNGKIINKSGFQVSPGTTLPRYTEIFKSVGNNTNK
jgi:hypothetical protein